MKWYAIPAKYDLWFVFGLAGLGWALIGGAYLYFADPFVVIEEQRKAETPEQIEVRYSARDCGDNSSAVCIGAHFSESLWVDATNLDIEPRTLAVPDGVPCPDRTELAVTGNRFLLNGYRYMASEKNVITGDSRETESVRVDVVTWEVIAPYSVVSETAGDQTVTENLDEPVSYAMTGDDHAPENFWMPEEGVERTMPCFEKPS